MLAASHSLMALPMGELGGKALCNAHIPPWPSSPFFRAQGLGLHPPLRNVGRLHCSKNARCGVIHAGRALRRIACHAAQDPGKAGEVESNEVQPHRSAQSNLDSIPSNSNGDASPDLLNNSPDFPLSSSPSSSSSLNLPSESSSLDSPSNAGADTNMADHQAASPSSPSILGSLLDAVKQNRIVRFVAEWPSWQQRRRLENLKMEADANPQDATKQALYLEELLKYKPAEVVERFNLNEYASNSETVVLYLKALVATDALSRFLPDPNTGGLSGIPALMTELKQKSTGGQDLLPPGMTPQQPLHVVMIDQNSKIRSAGSWNFMNDFMRYFFMCLIISVIWTLARAGMRRYVNGVAGISSSTGMAGPSNVYSPKEFNKENIPEKNAKTFNDIKGCDEAKEELEEIVQYLKEPAKFTRLGGKLPKGVLLIGPPGTGKTLLAKAIAGEAGVPFFYRAGSEFEEMFVGVGARRVRALFQAAKKKAPCIVFIDEIDAIGSSRKHWEGHTKKTLNQLLVEMDGFEANEGIIVIAATNIPESLDSALTRPGRFDRHVVVPNPDVKGRREILELYLKDKPISTDVDVKAIARGTPGFSGADLANLVNMAAVKAALDGIEKISSVQLEYAKDKILMGAERKSAAISEESRKLTAYHESGHAVVALNTRGADPIHKATITPRGNALGMVTQLPDKDETSMSKLQMLARLDVCMGGRVAEEMIFGPDHVTSGARSDLQQATKMAHHMVSECGMSDLVGPIYVDIDSSKISADMRKNIDSEVIRLLKEAYERVRNLLQKHEADLHTLAKALLENETLDRNEINALISRNAESFRQRELSQIDS